MIRRLKLRFCQWQYDLAVARQDGEIIIWWRRRIEALL